MKRATFWNLALTWALGACGILALAACVVFSLFCAGAFAQSAAPPTPVNTQTLEQQGAKCDGVTDDWAAVTAAFAAAKNNAFTLTVDCPARIHVGSDITRPIFIDNGTAVTFSGNGKFILDSVFEPSFVIANSSNIVLTNWVISYVGGLPVNWDTGGYTVNGTFVPQVGYAQPAQSFSSITMTQWLKNNRGVAFSGQNSLWAGPTNTSSLFFLIGDTSNVTVTGLTASVPTSSGGNTFIPMVFSMTPNYKSNQPVTNTTPITAAYVAVPHAMTFSNITFDGTYMGWQGNVTNLAVDHVTSKRYGDLQDATGNNIGGIGKWFAPPHLFYLAYNLTGDPALFNQNIAISYVTDAGPRIGLARDKGGTDTISGYANSLKIGCINCTVASYTSARLDGFLDILPSNGLSIVNSSATYNSTFLNNLYPGWRWPIVGYNNMTLENISITDVAALPYMAPMSGVYQNSVTSNSGLTFSNVTFSLRGWFGTGLPLPPVQGTGNSVSLYYTIGNNAILHSPP